MVSSASKQKKTISSRLQFFPCQPKKTWSLDLDVVQSCCKYCCISMKHSQHINKKERNFQEERNFNQWAFYILHSASTFSIGNLWIHFPSFLHPHNFFTLLRLIFPYMVPFCRTFSHIPLIFFYQSLLQCTHWHCLIPSYLSKQIHRPGKNSHQYY